MSQQPPVQRPLATDHEGSVARIFGDGGATAGAERSQNPAGAPPVQRPTATDNGGSVTGCLSGGGSPMVGSNPTNSTDGTIRQLGLPASGQSGGGSIPGGGVASSSSLPRLTGPAATSAGARRPADERCIGLVL